MRIHHIHARMTSLCFSGTRTKPVIPRDNINACTQSHRLIYARAHTHTSTHSHTYTLTHTHTYTHMHKDCFLVTVAVALEVKTASVEESLAALGGWLCWCSVEYENGQRRAGCCRRAPLKRQGGRARRSSRPIKSCIFFTSRSPSTT